MIKYNDVFATTHVRQWMFPDGCVGVDIQVGGKSIDTVTAIVKITCVFGTEGFTINDDLFALACVVDAIERQYPMAKLVLEMPYIPYARQDRAVSPGEAHQLKVAGKMINDMGFALVYVTDPHSTVANACIDRMVALDQYSIFSGVRQSFRETYIVAPDAGALKKCEDFAKRAGAAGVISCAKNRDLATGKIIGFRVVDDVPPNADLLVLDDLCDKGGTFMAVAAELRKHEPARLDLAVTHGLFTHQDGTDPLLLAFDKIFTTNSFISDKNNATVIAV